MINKIKKKIGEIFGKKDVVHSKEDVTAKQACKSEVQKEEIKRETEVKAYKKREEGHSPKTVESKRTEVSGEKTGNSGRNTRVRQDQNNRRKDRVEGTRRHNDSSSRGKVNNRRDNHGNKSYSDRKSSDGFKKAIKEEKLSNWIEEGLKSLVEGASLQYEGHSIEVIKKNTLGVQVNVDNSREIKITFDEMVNELKCFKGAQDIAGEIFGEEKDKMVVIRGIFQKN